MSDVIDREDLIRALNDHQFTERIVRAMKCEGRSEAYETGFEDCVEVMLRAVRGVVWAARDVGSVHVPSDPGDESHSCICHLGHAPCAHCTDCRECNA